MICFTDHKKKSMQGKSRKKITLSVLSSAAFVVVFLFREQLEIMRGCSYYANKTLLA